MNNTKNVPLVFFLFSILFLAAFSYTITNMASLFIVGDLGGSPEITSYTISFFALGNMIGIPLGKPLQQQFGEKNPLLASLLIFALFLLLSAFSTNYPMFILFRFLQGLTSGPFFVLTNTLLARLFTEKTQGLRTTITLTLLIISPSLAVTFGGWIAYDYDWSWIFYFLTFLTLTIAFFLKYHLKEFTFNREKINFDLFGFFLFSLAATSISLIFMTGQILDWYRSYTLRSCLIIGPFALILFIIWELAHENPLINLRLFKNFFVSYALLNLLLLFATYFGMIILLSLWLQLYSNYTPIWIGYIIGIMALASLIPALFSKYFGTCDARIPLGISLAFFILSSFYTSTFSVDINLGRLFLSRIFAGFGLALFLSPLFTLTFCSIPHFYSKDALILFQMTRALGSGMGIALYEVAWQRRGSFYHERLGEGLTPFSEATRVFLTKAKAFQLYGQRGIDQLNIFLDRQAFALALDDTFYLMGWISTALFILLLSTFFFRRISFSPDKLRSEM